MVGFGGDYDTGPDLSGGRSGGDGNKTSKEQSFADLFSRGPSKGEGAGREKTLSNRERSYNEAQKDMAKRGDTKAMQAYQAGLEAGDERFADTAEALNPGGFEGALRSLADKALTGLLPGVGGEYAGVNEAGDPIVARNFHPVGLAAGMAGPIPGGLFRGMAKATGADAGPIQTGMTLPEIEAYQAANAVHQPGGPVARPEGEAMARPGPSSAAGGDSGPGPLTRMIIARMFGGF